MNAAPVEVAVAIVERGGSYLIGRRPDGVPLAGYWEFPGGKIQAAESAEQAAARECWEETGLLIEVRAVQSIVEHQYEHARVRITFFNCKAADPTAEPRPPYVWRLAAELADLPFPPANAEILRQLISPTETSS